MLSTPPYIPVAQIATGELAFAWDEWRVLGYYHRDLDVWWPRLKPLTIRAQLTLTIAAAEWVFHRFSAVNSDQTPLQFIEAAWAGSIHAVYCKYFEARDDDWRGPVRNPLKTMMVIVNDALFHMNEDSDVAVRAAWMYSLATHVLPDIAAFEAWFNAVFVRLQRYHGRTNAAPDLLSFNPPGMGRPVPRDAFDPLLRYDPAQDAAALDHFLVGLDPLDNPFLNSPNDVAAADDFDGSPYRYP